jgi:transketolase
MENLSQRDAFWGKVYELAREDKNIVLVIADMGAPALDKFRTDLSAQYIDVGIAEQQAIALATGLALTGKKPFAYAIAPFISLRCYEHIRINMASMNLPVTIVGVGAGVSYDDSGPTHHAVEDLSALRVFPNLKIHNITDAVMAQAFAEISCGLAGPNYIRLDRKILPNIYDHATDFSNGLAALASGSDGYMIATGNMVHRALEVREDLIRHGLNFGVIDAYTFPLNSEMLIDAVRSVDQIITIEEHTIAGGLGSAVCEVLADHALLKPVKRIGFNFSMGYCYQYGGRENIQAIYGLDKHSILKMIISTTKKSVSNAA